MILLSVLISYDRPELTKLAIGSFVATVGVRYELVVADNGSSEETQQWLTQIADDDEIDGLALYGENLYPGKAFNKAVSWFLHDEVTHIQRLDNDFRFLPGWSEHAARCFGENPRLGQLGLRTDAEELYAPHNVGGNMIIRRELWDQGLRYDERPWSDYPPGMTEDSYYSPAVKDTGYDWGRVKVPCIVGTSFESWDDPYYARTWGERGRLR